MRNTLFASGPKRERTVGNRAASASAGRTFSNPIGKQNCPDPAILRVGGLYYVTCTSGNSVDAFPVSVSSDLIRWQPVGHIFPHARRPTWAGSDFWAPEIHRVGRKFVAYYTARDLTGRLCIGVASASSPAGPWEDSGAPLLRDDRVGMIDSHQFRDRDGRRYLYWKKDGNDLRPMERTDIYAQALSPEGLSLTGRAQVVLTNDRPWEGNLVEGPWVERRGAYYYLFYSGNNYWTVDYAVGVARSRSPFGPFVKREETLLRRDEHWMGPGHGCVVRGPQGDEFYAYHAWQRGRVGGSHPRVMLLDRIHWESGWPRINDGSPSSLAMPVP